MGRRKKVGDPDWYKNVVLSKAILETLSNWEEWWLHALREIIRRRLGYIEGNPLISEEHFDHARRTFEEWMKAAPEPDLRHTLILIDREFARRGTGPPDAV